MTAAAPRSRNVVPAAAVTVTCPLCDGNFIGSSWLGSVYYAGQEFSYSGCRSCGSVFCNPMPDENTLCAMYGAAGQPDPAVPVTPAPEAAPDRTIRLLMDLKNGTLIDYGCGSGAFLCNVAGLGWNAIGVEFDRQRAEEVRRKTGATVVDKDSECIKGAGGLADVVHLGDVLEHLTQMNCQFPSILRLLRPGGLVVATGPLEGNATAFNLVLRSVRMLTRRIRRTENPPKHVILATARGQKRLFERFGLTQVEFSTSEVSWPAPDRISMGDIGRPRTIALFVLSCISRAARLLEPADWGNRYYYIGRWNGEAASGKRNYRPMPAS